MSACAIAKKQVAAKDSTTLETSMETQAPTSTSDSISARMQIIRDEARKIAKISRVHFEEFRGEGFTRPEALSLVMALLQKPATK